MTDIEGEWFLGVEEPKTPPKPYRLVVCSTFLGVFMASADDTIITATYGTISSEFQSLNLGTWLLTGYNFGYCVTLPMYGMLGDIYSRKTLLLASYSVFGLGCLLCGGSLSLTQLILGRVIVGAGSSGMASLSCVAVNDLVPSSEISIWRGWAQVVNISGRSLGAPLGVFLMNAIGWRWLFLGQVPLLGPCVIAVIWKLPWDIGKEIQSSKKSGSTDRKHIDWMGMLFFASSCVGFMWSMSVVGAATDFGTLLPPLGLMTISGIAFWLTESRWAYTPLIPLEILTRSSLGIQCLMQTIAYSSRAALLAHIVPYFMRVKDMVATEASIFLVATSVGSAAGSLGTGYIIKRSKRCKPTGIAGLIASLIIHFMILIRWRHGASFFEGLYTFPSGVAGGLVFTSQFVAISNDASPERVATCVTVFLLSSQLGVISGSTLPAALLQKIFSRTLIRRLDDDAWSNIDVQSVLNEIFYSRSLPSPVQDIIHASYLHSFQFVSLFMVVCNILALSLFLVTRDSLIH